MGPQNGGKDKLEYDFKFSIDIVLQDIISKIGCQFLMLIKVAMTVTALFN